MANNDANEVVIQMLIQSYNFTFTADNPLFTTKENQLMTNQN
jgi:hypothetical protein